MRSLPLTLLHALLAGVARLDKNISPFVSLSRLQSHTFTTADLVYLLHLFFASFWLSLMEFPPYPYKLVIPFLYSLLLLIPLTSQFFLPAIPVAIYLLTFYSSRFISPAYRPSVSVSLLPTLETVLFGANISDILTRFTHPILDILAWIPYGVGHFTLPFLVALVLWLFRSKSVLRFWGKAFGYMNIVGVLIQLVFPCSPPWYEVLYGLTPANYGMPGSPGGLARIDALFHSTGYTTAFSNSPLVFGAFPSLHSACGTMEALFVTHFFPQYAKYIWTYVAVLYWSTMYLTHHYLIDVVGGACLATVFFYLFLPDELKGPAAFLPPHNLPLASNALPLHHNLKPSRDKYELYDLEDPRIRMSHGALAAADVSEEEDYYEAEYDESRPLTPNSAVPLLTTHVSSSKRERKGHRHTASIASLIRGEERYEEDGGGGWSPVTDRFVLGAATPPRRQRV
ncbi:hypothetical protein JOM56_005032 [Amanita muscaria]